MVDWLSNKDEGLCSVVPLKDNATNQCLTIIDPSVPIAKKGFILSVVFSSAKLRTIHFSKILTQQEPVAKPQINSRDDCAHTTAVHLGFHGRCLCYPSNHRLTR